MADWNDLRWGGTAVCDCQDDDEADLCVFVLNRAGLQALVVKSSGRMDLRWPQIWVDPVDAERARALLAGPVEDDVRAEWEANCAESADWPAPMCPGCGSEDILLESAEPVCSWQCDGCGHRWTDAVLQVGS